MTTFSDSGITVNVIDNNYFRFELCEAHSTIKGQSVTEMDFVYRDVAKGALWLVELKQFYDKQNPKFKNVEIENWDIIDKYLNTFHKNAWHTASMLAQNRSKTQNCAKSLSGFDFEKDLINILFILNLDGKNKDLTAFNNELKGKLKDVKAIFNIHTIRVISLDDAKTLNLLGDNCSIK